MPLAGKFVLRLFFNQTDYLNGYTLNKFNKFGEKFVYPKSPFMIFNFSACENLRHSWMMMSEESAPKLNSQVNVVSDASKQLRPDVTDCEGCVAFYRQDGELLQTLPQFIELQTDCAVGQRLEFILQREFTIMVILNEKQFFKLPIRMDSYRDSVISSVREGNQYKIQLEVRYTGIVIDFTFNFQVFDAELQNFLSAQRRQLVAVPDVAILVPAPVQADRKSQSVAAPKRKVKARLPKPRTQNGPDGETPQQSVPKAAAEAPKAPPAGASPGPKATYIGNDSLELDEPAQDTAARRKKRVARKKVPRRTGPEDEIGDLFEDPPSPMRSEQPRATPKLPHLGGQGHKM